MIIPIILGSLIVTAVSKLRKRRVAMTPELQKTYNDAINGGVKDPVKMDELAKAFKKKGLKKESELLTQRARLMRLPEPVKTARRNAFRKALKSKKKGVVLEMAHILDKEGATSAAMRLREYASGIPDNIPNPTEAPALVNAAPDIIPDEPENAEAHAAESAAGNNPIPPAQVAP